MSRTASLILLIVVALLVPALPASAGVGAWTPLGPDGGSISSLAVDPSHPRVVYAGTQHSGLYKSIDGGDTWSLTGRGLAVGDISAIVFDPQRSSTLYVMVEETGVYRSTDAGRTWKVTSPQGRPFQQAGGLTLAIDPRRPRALYAGTRRGVYRSTNGGATWKQHKAGLPQGSWVRTVAVDARTGTVYAGLLQHGIFRSDDQGATWKPAGTGLPEPLLTYALALDPAGSGTMLAGTDQGVYRSTDRGRSWTFAGGPVEYVFALAFQRQGRAYAGYQASGVFRSADAGATWQPALEGPPPGSVLGLAAGPDAVFAGTSLGTRIEGVFRSRDAGATWETAQRDLTATHVQAVEVDPSDSRTIYATVGASGLYKSIDAGASWSLLALPSNVELIRQIVVDPTRPSTVYLSVHSNGGPLLRSDDGGETWRAAGQPPPQGFAAANDLAADPWTSGALWAASGTGLFHSTDRGVTWRRIDLGSEYLVLSSVEVSPRASGVIYAAGMAVEDARPPHFLARVFRSTDAGATWQRRDAGLPRSDIQSLALDPADPATLWAATYHEIYRSTDAGATWRQVAALPSSDGLFAGIVAAPGALYAVWQGSGDTPSAVLYSADGGATWTTLRAGLGFRLPIALEVDPQNPDHLLLGTARGSLVTWTWP